MIDLIPPHFAGVKGQIEKLVKERKGLGTRLPMSVHASQFCETVS